MTSGARVEPAPARHPAAVAGRWTVLAVSSRAVFGVRDKVVATVHGTLPVEAGEVVVDDRGAVVSAWVSVVVTGISTGSTRRDRHLREPALLDAVGHPSVRVEVESTATTPNGWTARAAVRARGHRAPVDLRVELDPDAGEEVRVRVTGRLDRRPLGIAAPSLVIGRFLDLDADLTFRRVPATG